MKRVLTALILIPIVLCAVIWGPSSLVFAMVTLVAMLCYREYCGIAAGYGVARLGPVGFAAGLGVLALPDNGSIFLTVVTLAFAAGTFLSIATSDLLPELQFHAHDRGKLSLALLAGIGVSAVIGSFESIGPGPGPESHPVEVRIQHETNN